MQEEERESGIGIGLLAYRVWIMSYRLTFAVSTLRDQVFYKMPMR
ncbi:hypothetical protein HanIR_Chr02g0059461 [Helianthus annuus]|nr:hypothetical protein HanIR_Chr02g0059461 [Helianthus annuus]